MTTRFVVLHALFTIIKEILVLTMLCCLVIVVGLFTKLPSQRLKNTKS